MKREHLIRAFAGTIVLLGFGLGYFVDPRFLWLDAFVGLNLLQSAFTGFCPLEKILAWKGVGSAS